VSTPLTQHPRNQYTVIGCFLLGSGVPPVIPTNLRETCRRGLVSLPPRGCWFFNPFSRSIARPLLQAPSLPFALRASVAFHSSYHSLISRPGVRSLRHSWSLRSLTDDITSHLPFIPTTSLRAATSARKPKIQQRIHQPTDSTGSPESTASQRPSGICTTVTTPNSSALLHCKGHASQTHHR
jgi:hypothetical protein